MDGIFISQHKFKHYKNIIIHYIGQETHAFISQISDIFSYLVIENYEEIILNRLIFLNYFYFDKHEKDTVLEICLELLYDEATASEVSRQQIISKIFEEYLSTHKTIILDGFINFRLKKYLEYLNPILDTAVNQFIIEREYIEFISLLKIYINSESSSAQAVHLIYNNEQQSVLLDEDKNIIDCEKDMFKAKYLSDITFSANDYVLNTLLNILPQKIYIYVSDSSIDEFIHTLQLVFEDRIKICTQ